MFASLLRCTRSGGLKSRGLGGLPCRYDPRAKLMRQVTYRTLESMGIQCVRRLTCSGVGRRLVGGACWDAGSGMESCEASWPLSTQMRSPPPPSSTPVPRDPLLEVAMELERAALSDKYFVDR